MKESTKKQLEFLRLGCLQENWETYLKNALKSKLSNEKFLEYVINEAFLKKQEQARLSRMRRANAPDLWDIVTYPFDLQPNAPKDKILAAYDSLQYITEKKTLVWIGPTGVGKSGLATSFLTNAINQGYSGKFVLFCDLIEEIHKSIADSTTKKVLQKYICCDCLLIDEIGYIEVNPTQVGLFFRMMQSRHKKKTTLITTNLGFSDWVGFLKNEHLTSALIDRITENSHVFNFNNCISLRTKRKKEQPKNNV